MKEKLLMLNCLIRWMGVALLGMTAAKAYSQYAITGVVLDDKSNEPVSYATLNIPQRELWTITDEEGKFKFSVAAKGELEVTATCMGYVSQTIKLTADTPTLPSVTFRLKEDNLTLKEVVVTAQRKPDASSTYMIDRKSLDQLQLFNVADALSLLPGAKTTSFHHMAISGAHQIALRSAGGELGRTAFGTAIEVDGVRLSGNAAVGAGNTGADTRTISTDNIATIEVVTGIPSVEYGDMTQGIVKIKTRQGHSPLSVTAAMKPHTKLLAIRKGWTLGSRGGVLNISAERARSVSALASPYTSYERNGASLTYTRTFHPTQGRPLNMEIGLTGNWGGYNNRKDPDLFVRDYTKVKDNIFRSKIAAKWMLNLPWLTNIEVNGTVAYTDNTRESSVHKDSSIGVVSVRGEEEGYFASQPYTENPNAPVVTIFPNTSGYWDQVSFAENRPLNLGLSAKAKWAKAWDKLTQQLLFGTELRSSGNQGRGVYYADMATVTDNWRPYPYKDLPYMHNMALYIEDKLTIPAGEAQWQIMAGLRSDHTFIPGSVYGLVSSLSPRINVKYAFAEQPDKFIRRIDLRGGWGKAVKLPSFDILFPRPYYADTFIFQGGTTNRMPFYVYYTRPYTANYNPDLRWQYSRQLEVGVDIKMAGVSLSLSAFASRLLNSYTSTTNYTPFAYNMVAPGALDALQILPANRVYTVDRQTGRITVSDRTGQYPAQLLPDMERQTFKSHTTPVNGTSSVRRGVEWIVDVDKIPSLQTSFRWDGQYYTYYGLDEVIRASVPAGNMSNMENSPYKFVGYYGGGYNSSNGKTTKQLDTNLTVTTHIPAIRLIMSLRLEGTLYSFSQNLSEYQGQHRGGKSDAKANYPLYYTTYEDMQTKIPFAEKLEWAYSNNKALYNELVKLITTPNTDYYLNPGRVSAYCSANFSVTKEISSLASVSFQATNFINTMQLVRLSGSGTEESVFQSGVANIPNFYYGLTVRFSI